MAPGPEGVRVWRGGVIESLHRIHAVVVAADAVLGRSGDPDTRTFLRSSAKPIQLLPLVEDGVIDRYGLTGEEIAVMAASHGAESFHVAAVRSILDKAGVSADRLQCGAHPPMHEPTARAMQSAGEEPTRLHNNCSGKHAGMLAACQASGWPLDSYLDPGHPLQRRIRITLAELAGVAEESIEVATDGCGAPTFALSVTSMARAWDGLARADRDRSNDRERAIGVVVDAMVAHPDYVAGTGRLCTALMAGWGARVVVKTGAEGVYCAALRGDAPRGLALKVADGAGRAQDPAVLALLGEAGFDDPLEDPDLAAFVRPEVENRAGEPVGEIDTRLRLSS